MPRATNHAVKTLFADMVEHEFRLRIDAPLVVDNPQGLVICDVQRLAPLKVQIKTKARHPQLNGTTSAQNVPSYFTITVSEHY